MSVCMYIYIYILFIIYIYIIYIYIIIQHFFFQYEARPPCHAHSDGIIHSTSKAYQSLVAMDLRRKARVLWDLYGKTVEKTVGE